MNYQEKKCYSATCTTMKIINVGYLLPWVMMNRISELKRKTEESQKRQREMKRKSELFDQLIQPPVKQPRPHSMPSPDESTATTNGRDSSDWVLIFLIMNFSWFSLLLHILYFGKTKQEHFTDQQFNLFNLKNEQKRIENATRPIIEAF